MRAPAADAGARTEPQRVVRSVLLRRGGPTRGSGRLRSRAALALVLDGGAAPVAVDVEFEDGCAVDQPIDGRQGHGVIGEDGVPLAERLAVSSSERCS